jgi:hemoglobin/transferrin/lactoferrin receptor protein
VNDLSGNVTSRSGDEELGALDLDPEESWTFELGTRFANDCLDFRAAGFYTVVDDLIVSVPAPPANPDSLVVVTNAREADIYGVELETAWRFRDGWTLSGYLTWQDGESETPAFLGGPVVTDNVSRLSPLVGSVALRYEAPGGRWWAEGRITAADTQDDLSAGDQRDTQRIPPGGTPSYVVASMHAGMMATENLELTVGLETLTDEDYRVHGSGVNAPGFNAIFGVRMGF